MDIILGLVVILGTFATGWHAALYVRDRPKRTLAPSSSRKAESNPVVPLEPRIRLPPIVIVWTDPPSEMIEITREEWEQIAPYFLEVINEAIRIGAVEERRPHPLAGMIRIHSDGTIDIPRLPDISPTTSARENPGRSAAEVHGKS